MTTKDNIISSLRDTGRAGIEDVIGYMNNNGFFSIGCHHHHHYRGGLADHAWQTYLFAKSILQKDETCSEINPASLVICSLLHDFCDCSGMRHIGGHGKRSTEMLKMLRLHLSSEEFLAIRFHMSLKRHLDHPLHDLAAACRLRNIVHKADGASAKIGHGASITLD